MGIQNNTSQKRYPVTSQHLTGESEGFSHEKLGRRRTPTFHSDQKRMGVPRIAQPSHEIEPLRCEPTDTHHSLIAPSGLFVFFAQQVRKNGLREMWDSVIIRCEELADGTLCVRVFGCDPSWDELLRIAPIYSQPHDREHCAVLGCNLNHVSVPKTL
jgi:hypothetical protein